MQSFSSPLIRGTGTHRSSHQTQSTAVQEHAGYDQIDPSSKVGLSGTILNRPNHSKVFKPMGIFAK